MPNKIDLTIGKTAKVMVDGPEDPEQVWMVLHGYGQLAQFFIRKFRTSAHRVRIIAPEGFHRFYLEGHSGRVGASWMTREERLTDIEDYVAYLDLVWKTMVIPAGLPTAAIGFSQGVATLMRWINQSNFTPDQVVAWGGTFPPDLSTNLKPERFRDSKLFLAFGEEDELVTPEAGSIFQNELRRQGLQPEVIPFTGGHELDETILMNILL